jgi:uncharacterized spore protein YtfJ
VEIKRPSMDVQALLAQANDNMTVKRVFGEPVERDGVLVIPAAMVLGGGGGGLGVGTGVGPDGKGEGTGTGGGWGVQARPVGAYVIRDGSVTWVPAIDYGRIAAAAALVLVAALLTRRSIVQTRARARVRSLALEHRRK